jgi:NADH dehydrogenase (ubiquinone) Fe-S protein 3
MGRCRLASLSDTEIPINMACRTSIAAALRSSSIRPAVRAIPAVTLVARGIQTSAPALRPDAPKTSIPPFEEPVGFNPASRTQELSTPLHEYGQYLTTCLPKFVQQFSVYKDELTLYTAPSGIIPVITFLRDHHQCQYKSVMDITAVDVPTRSQRFEVSCLCNPLGGVS